MAVLSVGMRAIVHGACYRQLLRGVEAEGFELLLDGAACEPVEEVLRELLLVVGFEDDSGLQDRWVSIGGDADEAADRAEVLTARDCERDEAGLGIARFCELGGLGDVFSDGELWPELCVEAKMLERLLGGEA